MKNFWQRPLDSSSGTGQVFDSEQSDTSTSDIDISALLDHSNKKLSSPQLVSGKGASGWRPCADFWCLWGGILQNRCPGVISTKLF